MMLAVAETHHGNAWHIVRSVGRRDDQVLGWLKRMGVETYYPMVVEMRPVPRRRLSMSQRMASDRGVVVCKPQEGPLFPRYIFAKFDMGKSGWREAFKFAGVGGMVCEGDLPVWVPDALITSIRSRENNGLVSGSETLRSVLKVGDRVLITNGPFASFDGIVDDALDKSIEKVDPEDRITVAVNLFGRSTPVELTRWQIEKVG
jgi:transcription termination/antitermination protein NusG